MWALSLSLGLSTLCGCGGDPSTDEGDADTEIGSGVDTTETETESSSETGTATETGTGTETETGSEDDTGEGGVAPEKLLRSDEFINIAHRGGGALRPEETLIAYTHALSVGAAVIEMDLHASADGVVVLMHDDTVDRTTDGSGLIRELSLEALRELDAGYDFSPDGGETHPFRAMGVQVPTLEEVLETFPDAVYLMEIKQSEPDIVPAVLALLEAHDVGTRVVVASFNDATIEAVRASPLDLQTAMSTGEMVAFVAAMDDPEYAPPCHFIQPPWDLCSEEFVERAHTLDLKVHPWTVNGAALMEELIGRGVDGIMTDDPALLASVSE